MFDRWPPGQRDRAMAPATPATTQSKLVQQIWSSRYGHSRQIARSNARMRNSLPFSDMVNIVGDEPPQSDLRVVREALFVEGTIEYKLISLRKRVWLAWAQGGVMLHIVFAKSMKEVENRTRFLLEMENKTIRPAHASSVILFEFASPVRRIQMDADPTKVFSIMVSAHRQRRNSCSP